MVNGVALEGNMYTTFESNDIGEIREKKVIDKYITLFKCMENHGVLYIDNEIHMFCLHYVFKRRIQEDLSVWRNSYNVHGIRTEGYKNPMQLWVSGSLAFQDSDYSAIKGIFNQTNEDRRQQFSNFE